MKCHLYDWAWLFKFFLFRVGLRKACARKALPSRERANRRGLLTCDVISIDNPRVVISRLESTPEGLEAGLRSLSDQAETVMLKRTRSGKAVTISLLPHGVEVITLK